MPEAPAVHFTLEIPRDLHDSLNHAFVNMKGDKASLNIGIVGILQRSDLTEERVLEQIDGKVNDNINLVIPQALYDKLQEAALRHNTSERQIILRLMQEYVEQHPLPLLTSKGGPLIIGKEGASTLLTPPDVPPLPASEKSFAEQAVDKAADTLRKNKPPKFRI